MSMQENTEVLSLTLKDLNSMRKEFFDCYDECFNFEDNKLMLSRALRLQCWAIKSCKKQIRRHMDFMEE